MRQRLRQYTREHNLPDPKKWDLLIRSPGRINLIGEHTDYTGGLVLPAAINRSIYFLVRRIEAPEWRLHALDLQDIATVNLPVTGRSGKMWVDYLAGIGVQFQDRGFLLPGLEIVFGGDVPRGSGMSSSAALEGGMAFVLNEVMNAKLTRPEMAQLSQRSSNNFLGIPTGIMDQFASLNGRETGPIVLNCHTLEFEPVKNRITDHTLLLVNSMVTHQLGNSEYPVRVSECRQALEVLQKSYPELTHLSAAELPQLESVKQDLSEVVYRRARFVIEENERVRRAITAIEAGSEAEFGRLLNEGHQGLSQDYAVTCPETDFLQQEANEVFGEDGAVAGARQMGGGFGGCTINLVRNSALEEFKIHMTAAYQSEYGITPEFYAVEIVGGTEVVG